MNFATLSSFSGQAGERENRTVIRFPRTSGNAPRAEDFRYAVIRREDDLKAIGKVHRVRETAEKVSSETAYYLLSTVLTPERLNEVARQHWGVENSLHWRLDVVMNEDQDRTRMGHGPENLAVLRHMAINAMQKEGSMGSLRGKFKRAGWDDDFLYRLLEMF